MSQTLTTPPRPSPIDKKYIGSAGIKDYEIDQKLGEGTFGEVYKARCKKTQAVVALKKILMHNEKDGFPITALREIKLLKMLSHENVIRLEEMAVERTKEKKRATLYMVTPYMEHDLSGLLDNRDVTLTVPMIKCYMIQLLKGLRYLHKSNILHRDMKAANLLISDGGILKIADFGLARHYDEAVPVAGRGNGEAHRDYTTLVVTRWYRPPELLLQLRRYTPAIDLWGAGCVFGEMFKRKPILSGKSDVNQAEIIFDLVGSPNEQNMPGWRDLPGCEGVKQWDKKPGNLAQVFGQYGEGAVSLLRDLLTLDYRKRVNAIDALEHPYFKAYPYPAQPHEIPHFNDSHELDRRNNKGAHQELPPAPHGGTVGGGPNGEWAGHSNGSQSWGNGSQPRYGRGNGPPPPPPPHGGRVPRGAHDNRGPPGHDRRSNNHHYGDAPPVRAPGHLPPPPDGLRHALPPRPNAPPGDMNSRPPRDLDRPPRDDRRDRDRGAGRDRDRGGDRGGNNRRGPAADIDTYVPNYGSNGPPRRDERASADREDRHSQSTSQGDDRRSRLDYDDVPRDRASQRRTRSRSPERDRERERRERDYDVYRR